MGFCCRVPRWTAWHPDGKPRADPQKMGSAITYLRRYTLQSLLGLQAADDDANMASGKKVATIEDWQMQKIDSLIHNTTIEEKDKENCETDDLWKKVPLV